MLQGLQYLQIYCSCSLPPQLEAFFRSSYLFSEEPALEMFENSVKITLLLIHTSKLLALTTALYTETKHTVLPLMESCFEDLRSKKFQLVKRGLLSKMSTK